jgi:hypothetical protein
MKHMYRRTANISTHYVFTSRTALLATRFTRVYEKLPYNTAIFNDAMLNRGVSRMYVGYWQFNNVYQLLGYEM